MGEPRGFDRHHRADRVEPAGLVVGRERGLVGEPVVEPLAGSAA